MWGTVLLGMCGYVCGWIWGLWQAVGVWEGCGMYGGEGGWKGVHWEGRCMCMVEGCAGPSYKHALLTHTSPTVHSPCHQQQQQQAAASWRYSWPMAAGAVVHSPSEPQDCMWLSRQLDHAGLTCLSLTMLRGAPHNEASNASHGAQSGWQGEGRSWPSCIPWSSPVFPMSCV